MLIYLENSLKLKIKKRLLENVEIPAKDNLNVKSTLSNVNITAKEKISEIFERVEEEKNITTTASPVGIINPPVFPNIQSAENISNNPPINFKELIPSNKEANSSSNIPPRSINATNIEKKEKSTNSNIDSNKRVGVTTTKISFTKVSLSESRPVLNNFDPSLNIVNQTTNSNNFNANLVRNVPTTGIIYNTLANKNQIKSSGDNPPVYKNTSFPSTVFNNNQPIYTSSVDIHNDCVFQKELERAKRAQSNLSSTRSLGLRHTDTLNFNKQLLLDTGDRCFPNVSKINGGEASPHETKKFTVTSITNIPSSSKDNGMPVIIEAQTPSHFKDLIRYFVAGVAVAIIFCGFVYCIKNIPSINFDQLGISDDNVKDILGNQVNDNTRVTTPGKSYEFYYPTSDSVTDKIISPTISLGTKINEVFSYLISPVTLYYHLFKIYGGLLQILNNFLLKQS